MNDLRSQLHASREAYKSAKYPGDLADLLPVAPSRWMLITASPLMRTAAVVAFVAVSLSLAFVAQSTGQSTLHAMLPSRNALPALPARTQMAGAVKEITPPQVPGLLKEAKQPVVTSGQFILNIGKDIAHHADALFHMG